MNACVEEKKLTKGERTAQNILNVSEQLFAEKGFEATSLREVAKAVGIREPGLYRYFSSKEVLYREVLKRALAPLATTMDDLIGGARKISADDLPVIMFDILSQSPHIATLLQQSMTGMPNRQECAERLWIEEWLADLILKGRCVFDLLEVKQNLSEAEIMIYIMNLFNICTGYFSSSKALDKLTGQSLSSDECLDIQRKLIRKMAKSLLSD
ncbi:MAG: TetR/AcrR family transcriptional regulator [Endozoicomonas sp.]|uniref:TetR/AcrR family transcriptional regulator n=1 Tax=Endozoicomonas sp. TaxID=1892382 RepID=UPI003D9B24A4